MKLEDVIGAMEMLCELRGARQGLDVGIGGLYVVTYLCVYPDKYKIISSELQGNYICLLFVSINKMF